MKSSCTSSRPTRYGGRKIAATDWPVNSDSSPSTSMGRSSGFSQSRRGFGPAVVCSAISRLCIPRRPRRASLSRCPGLNGADCGAARAPWSSVRLLPLAVGDQPRSALGEEVAPHPLNEDEEAVLEADQVEDVDEQPRYPGEKSGEAEAARLRDGLVLPDGGHHPLVAIAERAARPALRGSENVARCQPPLLDGRRRQSRHQPSPWLFEVGHVTDHERIAMTGDRQVCVHLHPPGAIELDSERLAKP